MRASKRLVWVALCLMMVMAGCGEDNPEKQEALTTLEAITASTDRTALVGRKVELSGVAVTDVVGDSVFWVSEGGGRLPVALEKERRGEGAEGDITIRRGQRLSLSGTVRLVDTIADDDPIWRLVDEGEKRDIRNARVIIAAPRVQVQ